MGWREKLERTKDGKLVDIPPKMQKHFGTGKMLIPRPIDVERLMRYVKKGELVTQSLLREKLVSCYNASVACPFTTGIFVRIVAEAAEEDLQRGKSMITTY